MSRKQPTGNSTSTAAVRIRLVAIYGLFVLPFVVYGAAQALKSNNNSPIDWVTSQFEARRDYDEFVEQFGPGDALIISWEGCHWTDTRLDRLTHVLRDSEFFHNADGQSEFHRVISGRDVLLQMTQQTAEPKSATTPLLPESESSAVLPVSWTTAAGSTLSLEDAVERLKGTLIGPDGLTTCIVLNFTPQSVANRSVIVRRVCRAAELAFRIRQEQLHMAGPVIDGMTVDEASQQSLQKFALPSSLLIFGICWFSLRSLKAAAIVFATAGFNQAATLAIIHFTGESLSALLIILPPLIQVLAVAAGIHLTNYYFDTSRELSNADAAREAFRKGWLPCLLSSLTTAMGTASLMISGLTPIRLFGTYATIGVLLTAACSLAVVPTALAIAGVSRHRENRAAGEPSDSASGTSWLRWHRFLQSTCLPLTGVMLCLMVVAGIGLSHLKTSVRIETLFGHHSRIMNDYRWLEKNLGALVPIEILIEFPRDSSVGLYERVLTLRSVSDHLSRLDPIKTVTSAQTFLPPEPSMKSLPGNMREAVMNRVVASATGALHELEMLKTLPDGRQVWRVTAHCSAVDWLDYGDLCHDVREQVQEVMDNLPADSTGGPVFLTTGVMPLVHQIQGRLLSDLFLSLVSALLVITITMTLVVAGIRNGLLAMLPNIFPVLIMFGTMGYLGNAMDIGSVMTASVALGVAVDDTLHFLTFFSRGIAAGLTRSGAVLYTFQHCGRAMIQTSVSCGLGLLVFGLSDFLPTSRFAVLMAGLLLTALAGDLILLPALLMSPLGKSFTPAMDRFCPAGPAPGSQPAGLSAEFCENSRSTGHVRTDNSLPANM
ncbi:MAG: MMPL family transporter [Planctomycetaceae bacterium]|nr:MMPL family transporter [Planctomycetaceae bacterium]